MDSKYSVPIIPQNLYKHETIVHIAEVLDHLTNITDGIFAQINKRLETNKVNLSKISQRVETVNKKINTLRGAQKATRVFSSSKYPASDIHKEYVSIFYDTPSIDLKRHPVKLKNIPSVQGPSEKLQFYHVTIPRNNGSKLEGLGAAPESTEFVNDLLLYNSGKNVYKDFVVSCNVNAPQIFKEYEEHVSEIGAAPQSISERSTLLKSHKQNYFYSPQIGEVPALDVPLDLPDLPGIANDLHYDNDLNSSIAPSVDISPTILELNLDTNTNLPVIVQDEEYEQCDEIPIQNVPPVPISQEVPVKMSTLPEVQNQNISVERSVEPKSVVENVSMSENISIIQGDDVRSSLMEAIRNAGGSGKAKLKSVQAKEKNASTAQGGDLMADLHNKLFMRRKGISGAKQFQENSIDADTTLSRISSMIPAPEPKTDRESTSNDDEDWD